MNFYNCIKISKCKKSQIFLSNTPWYLVDYLSNSQNNIHGFYIKTDEDQNELTQFSTLWDLDIESALYILTYLCASNQ